MTQPLFHLPQATEDRRSARLIAAVLATACVMAAPAARAQTLRDTGPNKGDVNLGFIGTISGSVQMTITGTAETALSSTVNANMPTRATGTVDFGNFTTIRPSSASNCRAYRVASGTTGLILAAHLVVEIAYNGSTTASVTVARKNALGATPPDVALANLRLASPPLASWTSPVQGTQVPAAGSAGVNVCTLGGRDTTCQNLVPYDHELAIFVPDTQGTGAISTVVLYSGTSP